MTFEYIQEYTNLHFIHFDQFWYRSIFARNFLWRLHYKFYIKKSAGRMYWWRNVPRSIDWVILTRCIKYSKFIQFNYWTNNVQNILNLPQNINHTLVERVILRDSTYRSKFRHESNSSQLKSTKWSKYVLITEINSPNEKKVTRKNAF